ncbi:MAG TPA: lysophospholipid acyltransferase family protein [Myxococcales bacterium]|nr:lysophospholipid acyltransferase family protein [Myxococcales bacterium]
MPLVRVIVGAVLMALLATAALVLLAVTRSPGYVMRVIAPRWGRWLCAVAGIRLEVEGQEHLARSAVIMANHQSLLEAFIVPAIVSPKTRIVGKKELARIPFFGWAFRATGQILIDRENLAGARATIDASLANLVRGVSIYICPEGTRSQDGSLLPFKKGAFHIAMQTKMPVVTLTLDGAQRLMPKHAWLPRPGTVRVRISPPIDTSGWTVAHLDEHVAEVRGLIARNLEQLRAAEARPA